MPEVLITRPDYEAVTHYLFAWTQSLIEAAKKENWNLINLEKDEATSSNFKNAIKNNKPALILLHGHGSYTAITGQNQEIIIEAAVNVSLLKNSDTYAFSCETGKELGPAAIKAGAKSYIGYDEDFVFFQTKGKEKIPTSDIRAGKFMEPAMLVSLSLLNNLPSKKAWEKSQKAFRKNIEELITSKSKEAYLARYLLWDMRHQVCLTS